MGLEKMRSFNIRGQILYIESVSSLQLVETYETPLFIISKNQVIENFRKFNDAFASRYPKVIVCYSYKANYHPNVCMILRNLGCGADVMSGPELETALRIGVNSAKIVFTAPYKSDEDITTAIKRNIGMINIDSLSEISRIESVAKELKKKAKVGIRVNLGSIASSGEVESKFGISKTELLKVFRLTAKKKRNIDLKGIHCHIGTQIKNSAQYVKSVEYIMKILAELKACGIEIDFLDLGGGFGVSYIFQEDAQESIQKMAEIITESIKSGIKRYELKMPTLILEPGRYLVSNAGLVLSKVRVIKDHWAIIDIGINLLPRLKSEKYELVVANKCASPKVTQYNIGGPLGMESDVIRMGTDLPVIEEGDVIGVLNSGAYTLSLMSEFGLKKSSLNIIIVNSNNFEVFGGEKETTVRPES